MGAAERVWLAFAIFAASFALAATWGQTGLPGWLLGLGVALFPYVAAYFTSRAEAREWWASHPDYPTDEQIREALTHLRNMR
jgi:hypothetical protein